MEICVNLTYKNMKKLHFLVLLTLITFTGIAVNAVGQTNQEQIHKIFIDKKGGIHDHGGAKIGFIDKDNVAWNNKGQKVYYIDQNGNVIDANGKTIGKAKKNGFYYNLKGDNVIMVKDLDKEKCEILDPQGHSFGTVHKNYKLHACAAHCFFLEKEKGMKMETK